MVKSMISFKNILAIIWKNILDFFKVISQDHFPKNSTNNLENTSRSSRAGGSEGAAGSGEGLSISRASSTDRQRAAVPAFEGGGVLQASAHATLCGTLDVEEADLSVQ